MAPKILGMPILLLFTITLIPFTTASSLIIKMELEGVIVNTLSSGDNTPIPSSLELYVSSPYADTHSYPYSIVSGTLTINDEEYDIDGIMGSGFKSQKDKMFEIIHIIREHRSKDGKITRKQLLQKAQERNINEMELEKYLKKLQDEGAVFEPRTGEYSVL